MKNYTQIQRWMMITMLAVVMTSSVYAAEETKTSSVTQRILNKLVSLEKKPATTTTTSTAYATKVAETVASEVVSETKVAAPTATKKSTNKSTQAAKKSKVVELPDVDPEDEKAAGTTEKVKGFVSAKNNFGIAVVTGTDPEKGDLETWMNFTKKTKLNKYKNYNAIEEGDRVELTYKEIPVKDKMGLKIGHKWILREVSFIQKKPKEEIAKELAEAQDTSEAVPPKAPVVKL